jgi:AraC-like DNA-binding protein
MSLRTLHALFEETDETVAALIRRDRLARCRIDLERQDGGGVTEIALRWGFRDPGNFSRAFRHEFGLSPREVRQASAVGLADESFPETT